MQQKNNDERKKVNLVEEPAEGNRLMTDGHRTSRNQQKLPEPRETNTGTRIQPKQKTGKNLESENQTGMKAVVNRSRK